MTAPVQLDLLPVPAQLRCADARAVIWPERVVLEGSSPPRVERAVERLNRRLAVLLGKASSASTGPVRAPVVTLRLQGAVQATAPQPPTTVPQLGDDESYALQVTAERLTLRAESPWGALHGLETLLQLFDQHGGLPACAIVDQPRFVWRGLMLDVARHYLSLDALRRTLDCMAATKLNVLHLHLTDDQGFRFRSALFPKLASEAAYSAFELQQLVAYAADRGIRVVPELDMPGHVTSWLLAYPEWGTETVTASDRFGVHSAALNPADEAVYRAIDGLLGELTAVFPDQFLHIGGDEVHPQWWQRSASIQAYMRERGLADIAALQAHFNQRLHQLLVARQRRMLAWDEALHPHLTGLEPGLVIQNWRGATTRDRARAAGHACIVSSGYYLDLHYSAQWHYQFDPLAPQTQLLAHEDALLGYPEYAQVAQGIRWTHQWRQAALLELPGDAAPVLGGEACLWGELVDEGTLDVRLWTRLPAIAERFWSAAEQRDIESVYSRLARLQAHWAMTGLNGLAARQAAGLRAAGVTPHWQGLLQWFEPVKWYGRLLGQEALQARLQGSEMPQARPYTVHTPLDRAIDHLPVESLASRELAGMVGREDWALLAKTVDDWRALVAGNDCPPQLVQQREALAALLTLVSRRLADAGLNVIELEQLMDLQQPVDDLLLAPAFVLGPWLRGDVP